MSTTLSVQVSSALHPEKMKLEFLGTGEWTLESETTLLQRLTDILPLLRRGGLSLRFQLDVVVEDSDEAFFLIRKKLDHAQTRVRRNTKLSMREIEIMDLIMRGLTNQKIAEKLFISFETVRSHRKHVLKKLGLKNTAALINYYHQTFSEK